MQSQSRHQCVIYDGPPSKKLPLIALMIKHKMGEAYRCLYLNSPPMVSGIRSYLAAMGVDVALETARAALVLSSEPISEADFDIDMMLGKLEDALDQALSDGYKGLWATGDMTWEFGSEKNFVKLLEYELRLEELFRRRKELFGICQYHRDTLPAEALREGLLVHHTVFINETLSHISPYYKHSNLVNLKKAAHPRMDVIINAFCQLGR